MASAADQFESFALLSPSDVGELTRAVRGLNMTLVRLESKLAVFVEQQAKFIRDVERRIDELVVAIDDTGEFPPADASGE